MSDRDRKIDEGLKALMLLVALPIALVLLVGFLHLFVFGAGNG